MRRKVAAALAIAFILILAALRIASPPDDARGRAAPPAVAANAAPTELAAAFAAAEPAPEETAATSPAVPEPSPPAVPTSPPAPPHPSDPEPLPVIEPLPGLRFEAHFVDWLPPRIHGAAEWRIIGYRESLAGCRRVDPIPLGRTVEPMAFRILPGPTLGRPEEVGDGISIAVFLLAVPFDARGAPLGEHLVAHAAEAHLRVREIEEEPIALLRESAETIEFTVRFEDAPPDSTARGWFEHVAVESRWPAAELSSRLPASFPESPEAFADEAGWLRFSGARFDAPIGPMYSIKVHGWPTGMLWPDLIELRTDRAPIGPWTLAEPESLRISGPPRRSGFRPLSTTLHVYRRRPEIRMPPIEVIGVPLTKELMEYAVVIAQGREFAAEARFAPETGAWVWSVSRAVEGEVQGFQAILFVPGVTPATSSGYSYNDRPLRFALRPAEPGAVLGDELLVAPGLRLDFPIVYELELRCGGMSWRSSGQGLARDGTFTLGSVPRNCQGQLSIEVDAFAWALRLEDAHVRRWGRELRPLEVYAEAIGTTSTGATVLDVTVEHNGIVWPLAEFLVEFDLRP